MNILEVFQITSLYTWISYGLIVGVLAHNETDPRQKGKLASSILFAVAGAVLGGFTSNFLMAQSLNEVTMETIIASLGGAYILVSIYKSTLKENDSLQITS